MKTRRRQALLPAEATFATVSLREAAAFLLRGLPLAAVLSAVAVAGVWLSLSSRPVQYTAVASLLSTRQDRPPAALRGLVPASLDPALYAAAVANGPVLDSALARLPGFPPERTGLLSSLRVTSDNQVQSSVVRVSYTDADPMRAAALANLVAEELVAWDLGRTLRPLGEWVQRLEVDIGALDMQLTMLTPDHPARDTLLVSREQLVADLSSLRAVVPMAQLSLLQPAAVPDQPDSRRMLSAAAIAVAVAALLAYALLLAGRAKPRSPAVPQELLT